MLCAIHNNMQNNNQSLEKFLNEKGAAEKQLRIALCGVVAIALLTIIYNATGPTEKIKPTVNPTPTPALAATTNASR